MFKKLLVFALCLCLIFSFCGCAFVREAVSGIIPSKDKGFIEGNMVAGNKGDVAGGEVAGNVGADQNPVAEQSSSVSSDEGDEYTLEDFMREASGVWIVEGTVSHLYDNEYNFSFYTIENNIIVSGVYPGGFDRPGKIVGFKVLENLVFQLDLLYEAGEFMGDTVPEFQSTLEITFAEKEKLIVKEGGGALVLLYGGKTLEEAKANAKSFS